MKAAIAGQRIAPIIPSSLVVSFLHRSALLSLKKFHFQAAPSALKAPISRLNHEP
jgi:hypothetical protein